VLWESSYLKDAIRQGRRERFADLHDTVDLHWTPDGNAMVDDANHTAHQQKVQVLLQRVWLFCCCTLA
jgi:hypothetical protein